MKKSNSIEELEAIIEELESDASLDVQSALQKVKQGAEIIKTLQKKLIDAKNEFVEIEKSLK